MVKMILASLLATLSVSIARGQEAREMKLIAHWQLQNQICDEGDEGDSGTWVACGRSDALAAMLAERGYCLDKGINLWRVGSHSERSSENERHWSCALISS